MSRGRGNSRCQRMGLCLGKGEHCICVNGRRIRSVLVCLRKVFYMKTCWTMKVVHVVILHMYKNMLESRTSQTEIFLASIRFTTKNNLFRSVLSESIQLCYKLPHQTQDSTEIRSVLFILTGFITKKSGRNRWFSCK